MKEGLAAVISQQAFLLNQLSSICEGRSACEQSFSGWTCFLQHWSATTHSSRRRQWKYKRSGVGKIYSKIKLPDSAWFMPGRLLSSYQNSTNKHIEIEAVSSRPALSTETVPGQPLLYGETCVENKLK